MIGRGKLDRYLRLFLFVFYLFFFFVVKSIFMIWGEGGGFNSAQHFDVEQ